MVNSSIGLNSFLLPAIPNGTSIRKNSIVMNCVAFDRLSQNKSSCSTSSHKELVDSETEGNLATTNEKARPFNSALSV